MRTGSRLGAWFGLHGLRIVCSGRLFGASVWSSFGAVWFGFRWELGECLV